MTILHDVRYALRALLRQPLFTLVAVLTLALGIGANTAIFSLMYHAALRPLPFPDGDRLVYIWNSVSPYDPAVYGSAVASLLFVAILACLVPIRRATRIDPVVALREA